MNSPFQPPPILQNDHVKLVPLKENDFERLYKVASDPLIWEQHPNKTRWQREVFEIFFEGAIKSGGAFIIYDAKTNEPIGSSRFYDWIPEKSEVSIGYTFFARSHWGGMYNPAAKQLMMDYAFKHVEKVIFHIGANNIRSQKAIERLGAVKIAEQEMAYYGEGTKLNFIYCIQKNSE
jgi:N-acetyltransferase